MNFDSASPVLVGFDGGALGILRRERGSRRTKPGRASHPGADGNKPAHYRSYRRDTCPFIPSANRKCAPHPEAHITLQRKKINREADDDILGK
jgi:hypothetical protein